MGGPATFAVVRLHVSRERKRTVNHLRLSVAIALIVTLSVSCRWDGTREAYEIWIDGPASGSLTSDPTTWESFPGDGHILITTENTNSTALEGRVDAAGLVTIQVETRRFERSFQFPGRDSGVAIKRATWVISEPVSTRLTVRIEKGRDPTEMRLQIDRGADGSVDAEFLPQAAAKGDDLGPGVQWSGSNANVVVDRQPQNQYEVTLDNARGVSANFYPLVAVVYAVFPSDPVLRVYDGPFLVQAGDTVSYRVVYETASFGDPDNLMVDA